MTKYFWRGDYSLAFWATVKEGLAGRHMLAFVKTPLACIAVCCCVKLYQQMGASWFMVAQRLSLQQYTSSSLRGKSV